MGVNSHFNPTFNDPMESMVKLNSKVLDPMRHLAIIFKDNGVPKNISSNEGVDSFGRGKGIMISKGRVQGLKVVLSKVATLLAKSFGIVGDNFKTRVMRRFRYQTP
ncbi:hypothetical protein GOBAR_AA34670 [Gossypium barbadense]|uniref:Uncharacterized protein n=1 Tax=Gossypium barbadense TaxID=3634 RepID=A0A2P5W4J6_GOSBA|nr:hypothetical protein GOBAR_AA34670 [Gossypium barbadense]